MKGVQLTKMVQELELNKSDSGDRPVRHRDQDCQRSTVLRLQLTGYLEHFANERVQIIGYVEYTYLNAA